MERPTPSKKIAPLYLSLLIRAQLWKQVDKRVTNILAPRDARQIDFLHKDGFDCEVRGGKKYLGFEWGFLYSTDWDPRRSEVIDLFFLLGKSEVI